MRDCGGCRNFLKLKGHHAGPWALCEYHDARTQEDGGHKCKHFRSLKYERERYIISSVE